jgi:2-keto-4-pentenoate hydratase/2-oxohepta-3-ene-1,7-dioic acid hydratase in catechol pathway
VRFARLKTPTGPVYARLEGDRAERLTGPPWSAPSVPTATTTSWAESDLLCPVEPSKIVCVGRNYAAHAKELGNEIPTEPLLFFKPPSSLIGPGETVVLPRESARVEHEAELGVVIGRRVRSIGPEEAGAAIFGFTIVNDISARDLQKKDGQWARAKGFDTFCPTGPWIDTSLAPDDLRIQCRLNGAIRQDGRTSNMVFHVNALVAYISGIMTLEPGDLIATGTPEGVSPLSPGDVCEIEIGSEVGARAELGTLRVRVVAASGRAG